MWEQYVLCIFSALLQPSTLLISRAIAILKNNHIFTEIFSNWISHDNYLFSLLYSIIIDILDFIDFMNYIEFYRIYRLYKDALIFLKILFKLVPLWEHYWVFVERDIWSLVVVFNCLIVKKITSLLAKHKVAWKSWWNFSGCHYKKLT